MQNNMEISQVCGISCPSETPGGLPQYPRDQSAGCEEKERVLSICKPTEHLHFQTKDLSLLVTPVLLPLFIPPAPKSNEMAEKISTMTVTFSQIQTELFRNPLPLLSQQLTCRKEESIFLKARQPSGEGLLAAEKHSWWCRRGGKDNVTASEHRVLPLLVCFRCMFSPAVPGVFVCLYLARIPS